MAEEKTMENSGLGATGNLYITISRQTWKGN